MHTCGAQMHFMTEDFVFGFASWGAQGACCLFSFVRGVGIRITNCTPIPPKKFQAISVLLFQSFKDLSKIGFTCTGLLVDLVFEFDYGNTVII